MTSNKRGCEAHTPSLVPPIEASPLLIYSHCDQDFLRKLARDTEPESLEEWYNRHVVTVYKELS